MKINNVFIFSRFIIMPLALVFLNGCMSTVDKGYLISIEPTGNWQKTERFIAGNKNINIFSSCDYYRVEPSIFESGYTLFFGPPFLPIIPLFDKPEKNIAVFRLTFFENKLKNNNKCPDLRVNKGQLIKSHISEFLDTCYYWPEIPPTDFTMSFEGGLDGCKLDDLNFKVTPFNSVDWFWTFKG